VDAGLPVSKTGKFTAVPAPILARLLIALRNKDAVGIREGRGCAARGHERLLVSAVSTGVTPEFRRQVSELPASVGRDSPPP
jgi:hypothetical protein